MTYDWKKDYKADLEAIKDRLAKGEIDEQLAKKMMSDLEEARFKEIEKKQPIYRGKIIKAMRKSKEWTQEQLGEKCGMSASQIRNYELGFRNPKEKTLYRIAAALDIPSDVLLHMPRFFGEEDFENFLTYVSSIPLTAEITKKVAGDFVPFEIVINYHMLNEEGQNKAKEFLYQLANTPEYIKKEE